VKLPEDSHIASEKLTRYLLVPQARGHPACANHLDDRILERRDKVHYPDPRLGALKT